MLITQCHWQVPAYMMADWFLFFHTNESGHEIIRLCLLAYDNHSAEHI